MESTAGRPPSQGLYDPAHVHVACGVGCVADITGRRSLAFVEHGLSILYILRPRGATMKPRRYE